MYSLSPSLPPSLTHTNTHTHTLSLSLSHTHSLHPTLSLSSLSLSLFSLSLTHSLHPTLSLSLLSLSLSLSLSRNFTQTLSVTHTLSHFVFLSFFLSFFLSLSLQLIRTRKIGRTDCLKHNAKTTCRVLDSPATSLSFPCCTSAQLGCHVTGYIHTLRRVAKATRLRQSTDLCRHTTTTQRIQCESALTSMAAHIFRNTVRSCPYVKIFTPRHLCENSYSV